MEFNDVVFNRRSIRKFKKDIVPSELIMAGIKNGILAPSAHNRQPWKFKILGTEQKNYIADLLENKTKDIAGHTGTHTANVMRMVPNLVMVFIDNDIVINRDMDVISIGACIQNIILSYENMGLGTLWIGNTNFISNEIKEYLNVPFETISCIGVGYKDQMPNPRPRKDLSDVVI